MMVKAKFKHLINYLLLIISTMLPFIGFWKYADHRIFNIQQISVIVALIAIFKILYFKKDIFSIVHSSITKYYGYCTLTILISYLVAGNSFPLASEHLITIVELYIIYICLDYLINDYSYLNKIYSGLLIGILACFFIATMQFLKIPGFELFAEDDLNSNVFDVGSDNVGNILRIWGPFGNPLTFSLYLGVVGIVIFYYLKNILHNKTLAWIFLLLVMFYISLTISRTSFLSVILSVLLIEFLLTKSHKVYLLFFVFSILIVFLILTNFDDIAGSNALLNRLGDSSEDLKQGRLGLWIIGFDVWLENIFWGAGPGNLGYELFNHGWTAVDAKSLNKTIGHVENYYLTYLFTFGLIAFIFYMMFLIKYYGFIYEFINKVSKVYLIPVIAGNVCFLINNITNPILISNQSIQILFIILMLITNFFYKSTKIISFSNRKDELLNL